MELDTVVRDSSVGIATHYGLDGQGSNPIGVRFLSSVKNGLESHPNSCTKGNVLFPGIKAAGAWIWPPPPTRAEVKE